MYFDNTSKIHYRLTLMEYADGDVEDLIRRNNLPKEYYTKIYLQILIIIYFLNEYIPGYNHNDTHMGNFLLRKNKKNHSLHYKFDDFDIIIDDINYIVLISDFDFSEYISDRKPILNFKTEPFPKFKKSSGNFQDLFKATNHFLCKINKQNISNELYELLSIIVPPKLARHTVKINKEKIVWYHLLFINENHKLFKEFYETVPTAEKMLKHKVFSKYLKYK